MLHGGRVGLDDMCVYTYIYIYTHYYYHYHYYYYQYITLHYIILCYIELHDVRLYYIILHYSSRGPRRGEGQVRVEEVRELGGVRLDRADAARPKDLTVPKLTDTLERHHLLFRN